MMATLKFPVLGFTEIRLIIKHEYKWLAELVGADLEIEVAEDEFISTMDLSISFICSFP